MFGADYSRGRMITGVFALPQPRARNLRGRRQRGAGHLGRDRALPLNRVQAVGEGHGVDRGWLRGRRAPPRPRGRRADRHGGSRWPWPLAAAGGEVVANDEGFELAFKADALCVGTSTRAGSGPGGNPRGHPRGRQPHAHRDRVIAPTLDAQGGGYASKTLVRRRGIGLPKNLLQRQRSQGASSFVSGPPLSPK